MVVMGLTVAITHRIGDRAIIITLVFMATVDMAAAAVGIMVDTVDMADMVVMVDMAATVVGMVVTAAAMVDMADNRVGYAKKSLNA